MLEMERFETEIFDNITEVFLGHLYLKEISELCSSEELEKIDNINTFKGYGSEFFKELIVQTLLIYEIPEEPYFQQNIALKYLEQNGINVLDYAKVFTTDTDKYGLDEIDSHFCITALLANNEFDSLALNTMDKYVSYIDTEQPKELIEKFLFLQTYFNWEFDVNVFKLLGSQLISDKFTAIIELVKNSYDANATEVKIDFIQTLSPEKGQIIISDNGIGMSKEDISKKWMRIGTNNKRVETHSPSPFNRIYLGEKGIGRFAIEKIADHITLLSKEATSAVTHKLTIDWSKYEASKNEISTQLFTTMQNRYEVSKNDLEYKSGTTLHFTNLKEEWTELDIKRLKKELAKFVSPISDFDNKLGFKILIKEELVNSLFGVDDYEEILNSSLNYASIIYKISSNIDSQEELHFNENTNEMEILNSKIRPFGPIKMYIYYFNSLDKRKYKAAYKAKDLKIDGFKIYRDSILTTPFVEVASPDEKGIDSYRDVLGIDRRRWSNFFGKISSHDFIGIIEITKKDNPQIRDLTNRQNFEDTKEYKLFKDFIFEQIKEIEAKLDYEKKLLKEKEQNKIKDAESEVIDIRSHLNNLLEQEPNLKDSIEPMYKYLDNVSNVLKISSKEIDELNETIERKDELYHSLMSLQEYAADLAHMVKNSLDKILSISRYFVKYLEHTKFFNKSKMLNYELLKMREDVTYMLDYAESGHKLKEFDLSELMMKVFNRFDESFENEGIKVTLTKPDTFLVTHVETFMRDIFNNLISNSRKSLKNVQRDKKIIKCTAYKNEDEFIIIFSDNGIGIEEDIKERIFDRYFSTTKDEGGSGIGLYVVKNNLKTLNGKIELIDSEFGNEGCSFKMTIPLKNGEIDG
jgi:signal transduction histidine kinase